MDKNQTEIFGELTYAESLTYEELLQIETELMEQIDNIFLDAGAEHLDFTPLGDILMFQCAFEFRNLEIMRDISEDLASTLPRGVRGRILCLEKNLTSYHIFWVFRGKWQEKAYTLPSSGPEDAQTHIVKSEDSKE